MSVQLSLFSMHDHAPTWDDVQKGRAELITRFEPCDQCAGDVYGYWRGGKCTHTAENYAYPKLQPDGTCRRGYLEWKEQV